MPEYSPQVCNYNILYNILAGWSRLEGDFFLSCVCTLYQAQRLLDFCRENGFHAEEKNLIFQKSKSNNTAPL